MKYPKLILSTAVLLLSLIYIPYTVLAGAETNLNNTKYNMTELEEENNKIINLVLNTNVSADELSYEDSFGLAIDTSPPSEIKPAKFLVSVNKTTDCYLSNECWKIDPRSLNIKVYSFYNNNYDLASSFPGSYLAKILIFDNPLMFRHGVPLYVETIATEDSTGKLGNYSLSYKACQTYLDPGEVNNCKISIKPK